MKKGKIKRIFALLFVTNVIISTLFNYVHALTIENNVTSGDWVYEEILDDDYNKTGKLMLKKYNGSLENVIIPSYLDGKPVVETTCYVFSGNSIIKSVTLPDTLKKLFTYTFYNCENLEKINIPNTVEVIDETFVGNCPNAAYTIPSHLERLGKKLNISYVNVSTITLSGAYNYLYGNEIIKLINKERKNAGKEEYLIDEEIMRFAITRAPELAIYLGHERPNGLSTQSLLENQRIPCNEIIGAGQSTPKEIVNEWLNSQYHRPTIMSSSYKVCGAACYIVNGNCYWIFVASTKDYEKLITKYDAADSYCKICHLDMWREKVVNDLHYFKCKSCGDIRVYTSEQVNGFKKENVEIKVSKYHNYVNLYKVQGLEDNTTLEIGQTITPTKVLNRNNGWLSAYVLLNTNDVDWKSSNNRVFSVDNNGNITAVGGGKAILTVSLGNSKLTYNINVNGKELSNIKGDLDGNGVITANDASMALDLYKNGNATDEDIKIGDMDNSGTITANDASMILDMYKNGK